MNTKLHCPHCEKELSEKQLKTLWAEYCGKKKSAAKSKTAKDNGKKGGRPMTYFQDVFDAIPASVESLLDKLEEREFPCYDVSANATGDPTETGFDLRCEDMVWHCKWNDAAKEIEVTENGKPRERIRRRRFTAKLAAGRLVKIIHDQRLWLLAQEIEANARSGSETDH